MRPERLYLQDMVDSRGQYRIAHHPEVPRAKIVAFRNLVVHEYFGLDWSIVRNTATTPVPGLRTQIAGVLAAESPEDAGSKH